MSLLLTQSEARLRYFRKLYLATQPVMAPEVRDVLQIIYERVRGDTAGAEEPERARQYETYFSARGRSEFP